MKFKSKKKEKFFRRVLELLDQYDELTAQEIHEKTKIYSTICAVQKNLVEMMDKWDLLERRWYGCWLWRKKKR